VTFPWANKIAQLYEEYDFEYLEFYYKREVSEFAVNGQAGKIILSFDYDASDSAPTTKQQVEDTVPHADAMPCTPMLRLPIDCARIRKNPAKFVRFSALPPNTDLKTYDAGNLFVSTVGCTNSSLIGELHVGYRCRLSEPVLEVAPFAGGSAHWSTLAGVTASNFASNVLQAGSSPQFQGVILSQAVASPFLQFPAGMSGNYFMVVSLQAQTSATAISLVGFTAGATALNVFNSGAPPGALRDNAPSQGSAAGTTAPIFLSAAFSIGATGGTVTWTNSTTVPTTGISGEVWVFQLAPTLLTETEEEEIHELQEENKLLNDRLSRIEQMLTASSSVPSWLGSRLSAEEKEDEDSEGNVYVPARPRKLPARAEAPLLESLRR
jgi:hypothetical protein